MHQDFLATSLHPQDGQHRDRAHAPAQADPQVKAIQVESDEIQVRQRARSPDLELGLQPLDDPADCALRQGPALQERLQGPADPPGVRPAQVGLQHGLVDLAHPPGVRRQDLALPFRGAGARLQARPGHGQRHGTHRAGDRAHLRPVSIAQPGFATRVRGPEHRGELRAHEMLNSLSHHGLHLGLQGRGPIEGGRLVPGRLLWQRRHWRISSRCAPPRASRLVVSNPPRRYAISLFHNYRDAAARLFHSVCPMADRPGFRAADRGRRVHGQYGGGRRVLCRPAHSLVRSPEGAAQRLCQPKQGAPSGTGALRRVWPR